MITKYYISVVNEISVVDEASSILELVPADKLLSICLCHSNVQRSDAGPKLNARTNVRLKRLLLTAASPTTPFLSLSKSMKNSLSLTPSFAIRA